MFRRPPLGSYYCLIIQLSLLSISTIYILLTIDSWNNDSILNSSSSPFQKTESLVKRPSSPTIKESIHIATVTCTNKGNQEENYNFSKVSVVTKTVTLVKILISAVIHKIVSEDINFHIFVDSNGVQEYLTLHLNAFKPAMKAHGVTYQVQFHSVYDNVVPSIYQQNFISGAKGDPNRPLPCTFIRIFLHQGLSKDVTKVLYLDTDIIVTGNIRKVWNTKLVDEQALALAQNNKNYGNGDAYNFEKLPRVPPKGLNAGVILMNLSILRESNWTKNISTAYQEYTKKGIHMNDQRLINVLLYLNIRRLKVLPCHYNFQYIHCQKEHTCWDGNNDPEGIQIIHAAGDILQYGNKALHKIYNTYKRFDLATRHDHIIDELFRPVSYYYTKKSPGSCNGRIGHLLYRDLF